MAFTKFAKLQVLDVKGAPSQVRSASLTKFADFDEYRTDDGYMYVRVRAISSRVNKNHDGWPAAELKKAYRTFIGKPIFVDHHNTDPKRARGVIVDAALHVEDEHTSAFDPYYAHAPAEHLPPTWVELLLEVDAKRFPKLAKAIIENEIDSVSMGANVEMSKCSHCGNEARTPEEFCKHVQAKGAYFDYVDKRTGEKTSKRSYEDCYDIGFFEISCVFDPADETALKIGDPVYAKKMARIAAIRNEGSLDGFGDWTKTACLCDGLDTDNCSECGPMNKTAEQHEPPQSDMTSAPTKVNTLRQEQVCPVCGSDMEDGICQVCNFEEPPEGFDNPDLDKAKAVDEDVHQQDVQEAQGGAQEPQADVQPGPSAPPTPLPGGAMPATASTSKDVVASDVNSEKTAASQGGRIHTQERPILPVTRQLSDKPIGAKTVSEAKKPVESHNKENMTDTQIKTADGATPQGDGVQAEKRVDVEGVGAVSGDPLKGIEHENVEKNTGDFTAPHTDTWSAGEGDSLGQQDAVTSETGDFFTVSSDKTAETGNDAGGPIGEAVGDGGSAKDGGPTWDTSDAGFPDHQPARVDLNAPLKEEVGEGTKTFGSDDLHVGQPVTKDNANELGGPIGVAVAKAKAQQLKAIKVAEAEISAGLIEAGTKWERVAELEDKSEETLEELGKTASRIKSAGLKKTAGAQKTAATGVGRMPSFAKTASFEIEAHSVEDDEFGLGL